MHPVGHMTSDVFDISSLRSLLLLFAGQRQLVRITEQHAEHLMLRSL